MLRGELEGVTEVENICIKRQVLWDHIHPIPFAKDSNHLVTSTCVAGDATYQRLGDFGDDIVVLVTYHTPICKENSGGFDGYLSR